MVGCCTAFYLPKSKHVKDPFDDEVLKKLERLSKRFKKPGLAAQFRDHWFLHARSTQSLDSNLTRTPVGRLQSPKHKGSKAAG